MHGADPRLLLSRRHHSDEGRRAIWTLHPVTKADRAARTRRPALFGGAMAFFVCSKELALSLDVAHVASATAAGESARH